MKLGFKIIEKVIAIVLILMAGLMIEAFIDWFNLMHKYGYYPIIEPNSLLFIRFLKHFYAIILLCLFEIIGGTLLFFNRKAGWMIAMIALLTDSLVPVVVRMLLYKTRWTDFFDIDDLPTLVIICWFIFFSSLLVIMCLKPFRLKYLPTMKTYFGIAGVSVLLLIVYANHI